MCLVGVVVVVYVVLVIVCCVWSWSLILSGVGFDVGFLGCGGGWVMF